MTTPKPPWSILDSSHPYVSAVSTNIAATFKRERERLKREAKEREETAQQDAQELKAKLLPIRREFERRRNK